MTYHKLFWTYGGMPMTNDPRFDGKEFHRQKMITLITFINSFWVNKKEKLVLNCGYKAINIMKEALIASGYSVVTSESWDIVFVPSMDDNVVQFYEFELTIGNDYGDIPFMFYSPFEDDTLTTLARIVYDETKLGNLEVALSICKVLKEKLEEIV